MNFDAAHYALAGVIVALAGSIVGLAKHLFSTIQKSNEDRLKDAKTSSRKNEQTLEKILPLAEALSGIADDFLKHMEMEGSTGDD